MKSLGYWVRGVEPKYRIFSGTDEDKFEILVLRPLDGCLPGVLAEILTIQLTNGLRNRSNYNRKWKSNPFTERLI